MNQKTNNELVIDVKELLWRLLEQWKAIVAFSVIIAVLFSCFMYSRSGAEENDVVLNPDDVLSSLSIQDQEKVLGILSEHEAVNRVQRYITESPLMNLDPYNISAFCITWLVDSDEKNNKQISATYLDELSSIDLATLIDQAWGGKYGPDSVRELLNTTAGIEINSDIGVESNTVKLAVYLPEGMSADGIDEVIESKLSEVKETISNSIGSHQVIRIRSGMEVCTDQNLAELQYNTYNRFYNLNSQLNNVVNGMSAEQKQAYEKLLVLDVSSDETNNVVTENAVGTSNTKFFNKRYLAVGFVLGSFVYAFLYFLYFVFSGKVFSTAILEKSFSMRTLAELYSCKREGVIKTLTSDVFLGKMRHRGHMDMTNEVERIYESIRNDIEGKGSILLVCNDKVRATTSSFIELLSEKLRSNSITVNKETVSIDDGITLRENAISTSDAVVAIIDEKVVRLKDIKEICDRCNYCKRKVVGAAYIS